MAEAAISRYKRVIGDAFRSRTDRRQATEVAIGVHALNRMLEFGRQSTGCLWGNGLGRPNLLVENVG